MVKIEDADDRLSGCDVFPVVVKPVVFLGSTVLSFNASLGIGPTQESTLTLELVNDCKTPAADSPDGFPDGDHFYGAAKLGSPVFFDTCDAVGLGSGSSGCFHFGGILTNYTAQQSSNGLTFNARVVDPRGLLENAIIIVDSYLQGPITHRNYFNAYAYYEYNTLPSGLKQNYPVPTGLLLEGGYSAFDGLNITISGAQNEDIFFPSGNFETSDCSVFGTSDKNDRGMTGRKILQALNNIEPLIYSPNYGEPYNPPLQGKDSLVAAGRLNHEANVFRLDMSGFPEPPPYYRVAGPSITILQLLTEICDITGREFIVYLVEGEPGKPPIIKIETKRITEDINPEEIKRTIIGFNGRATELNFGEELRVDKNRTILVGEQEHVLVESSEIQFYFGEDSQGDPIVPVLNTECGFEIVLEPEKLNALLNCPLFDPDLHEAEIPLIDKVLKRKVVISEIDLRTVLSSNELWKARLGAVNAPGNEIRTRYPEVNPDTIDLNRVLAYNFNDIIGTQLVQIFQQLSILSTIAEEILKRQSSFTDNAIKGIVDNAHNPNDLAIAALTSNHKKDLDTIYDYLQNLGRTYYGKQYLVGLPEGICTLPAGLYDEDYFGVGSGTLVASLSGIYTPPKCSGEITDPAQLENKIYRERLYSHVPTNAGGWAEPCTPVLGLYEPELSFFKTEDFRVQSFARFDTKDVKVNYTTGILLPDTYGIFDANDQHGQTKPADPPDITYTTTLIKGVCGEIDIGELSPENYVLIRDASGVCELPKNSGQPYSIFDNFPRSGIKTIETDISTENQDIPIHLWLKAEVEDKIYILRDKENINCFVSGETPPKACSKVTKAIIRFNDVCLKKPCNIADNSLLEVFKAYARAIEAAEKILNKKGTITEVKDDKTRTRDTPSETICGIPKESGTLTARSALDLSSLNNKGYCPAADLPTAVCVPLKSNISTYGPWYSPNFNTSAGGISFEKDNDLAPWNYGTRVIMNNVAQGLVKEAQVALSETETGSITHPGMPLLSIGFLDNGPNLTNVNVVFGGGGITSNYNFQTYTPRFGALKNLQNQQLKESIKNKQRAQRILKDRLIQDNKINRKINRIGNGDKSTDKFTRDKLTDQGTLHRVLIGEIYDFSLIRDYSIGESGEVIGSGQRTVIGTDTLEKSALEMRFDYEKKAFMSWDGLLSPVSISGDGDLPMFTVKYTGYPQAAQSISIAPNPPVVVMTGNASGSLDIKINQEYLNPLTNNFAPSGHHHMGSGAGHVVDIVGRGTGVPATGMIMNFYGQQDWESRYAQDYRFLGLKGPLVLHAWGYDTQGKPIPNYADDEINIKNSGIYISSGLYDYFLQDWLHKPSTWPVAPVDLRFDRERGVWVSPPQHKIVVAQALEDIDEYGSGSGLLINEKDGVEYGQKIYDSSGNLVSANDGISQAQIQIEDRIGVGVTEGDKAYAYFDSFSSKYLLLAGGGGGSTIKLGKFMNQWPSLSNVKEPMNAIKDVHLYKPAKDCPSIAVDNYNDKSFCPWTLQPEMEKNESGVYVPKTVKVMNLFANVASPEYQAKWCMFTKIDGYYYLLAAEC